MALQVALVVLDIARRRHRCVRDLLPASCARPASAVISSARCASTMRCTVLMDRRIGRGRSGLGAPSPAAGPTLLQCTQVRVNVRVRVRRPVPVFSILGLG